MAKHSLWRRILQVIQDHPEEVLEVKHIRQLLNDHGISDWQVFQATASLPDRGFPVNKVKGSRKLPPGDRSFKFSPVSI